MAEVAVEVKVVEEVKVAVEVKVAAKEEGAKVATKVAAKEEAKEALVVKAVLQVDLEAAKEALVAKAVLQADMEAEEEATVVKAAVREDTEEEEVVVPTPVAALTAGATVEVIPREERVGTDMDMDIPITILSTTLSPAVPTMTQPILTALMCQSMTRLSKFITPTFSVLFIHIMHYSINYCAYKDTSYPCDSPISASMRMPLACRAE